MPARHERALDLRRRSAGTTIMLNRAALILRYKQSFVDWINAADPSPTSHPLTLAEVNQEHTVYLVEVEDEDELAEWLARHHEKLFEEELKGWYTDPALWPRDQSLEMLQEWCSFELHTVVVDTGESSLEDDEREE
jgi:hypothetical protein